jgi:uncharacterized membrane protein
MPEFGGFMEAIFGITLLGILASILVPIIVIVAVIWAIRRSMPARRDPAEQELRERLARGEIGQAEFLVRMRALNDGDDKSIV